MSTESEGREPTEEELRAAYEAQVKQIRVEHILLENVVTLANLGMRRTGMAPGTEDERDPDQVRLAIDAIRAMLPMVEQTAPQQVGPIRDALSQLQLAYVRIGGAADRPDAAAGASEASDRPEEPSDRPETPTDRTDTPSDRPQAPREPPPEPPKPGEPGPAQRSGRLWVPGQR
jgi:hypothetical protein